MFPEVCLLSLNKTVNEKNNWKIMKYSKEIRIVA